jgi:hypothetical protein
MHVEVTQTKLWYQNQITEQLRSQKKYHSRYPQNLEEKENKLKINEKAKHL